MSTTHFTIVTLEQGSEAWREWRHKGIGASDASTIMGENRFKSAAQLLQEKRGPARDFGQNAAMARGTELEPEARRLYVAKTGRDVRPACLQSTRYDWLRASLDGLAINHDAVVEIKCGQSAYRTASQTRSVPDYYYGQMQHILAVTGLDSLDFWCYWPGYPASLIPVPRNVAYIERLLNKELEFWNHVNETPNHALQRTAPGVTACASHHLRPLPPAPTHRLRRPPQSLSLGRCADTSACRACQRARWNGSVRHGDTDHALWSTAASQRPGGAWQSAHRGGGTEGRPVGQRHRRASILARVASYLILRYD